MTRMGTNSTTMRIPAMATKKPPEVNPAVGRKTIFSWFTL
jgi:hypothetical protein